MSLARVWTRQLYGASGAALVAPGAVVAALLALGLAGGFGQLGTLSQAFAGPAIPASSHVGGAPGSIPAPARVLPIIAAPAPTGATPVAAPGRGGNPAPSARRTTPNPGTASIGPGTGTGSGSGAAGSGGAGTGTGGGSTGSGGGSGGGGGTGGGTPTGQPTLVDGVVKLGTSITKHVPGPVGALATQLLESLGKTVDGVLPQSAGPSLAAPAVTAVKGLVSALHLP
jgi:hypothetical protein